MYDIDTLTLWERVLDERAEALEHAAREFGALVERSLDDDWTDTEGLDHD